MRDDASEPTEPFGPWGPPVYVRLEPSAVWAFARAVCDENPAYARAAAVGQRGAVGVVPPTFSFAWGHTCALPSLQPDGVVASPLPPGTDLFRRGAAPAGVFLHGEQAFTFHRPPVVGEELVGRTRVGEPVEKVSSHGTMVLARVQTRWSSGDEPVVTEEATYILLLS